MMTTEVTAKTLIDTTSERIESLVRNYLNIGFTIQNSALEVKDGKINAVYVFTKKY